MGIAGIPEIICDFNMYRPVNKLVGITGEIALPDLEGISSTISGPGILGEYETVAPGHFGSLEQEINFRCIDEDYFQMIDPTMVVELMLRGAIKYTVKGTRNTDFMGMRIVERGYCKKISIGSLKQRESMESKLTLELTYYMVEMDRKKRLELDKLNGICRVNDYDLLAKVRQLT